MKLLEMALSVLVPVLSPVKVERAETLLELAVSNVSNASPSSI